MLLQRTSCSTHCTADTGAGIALHSKLGRGLLQDGDINTIPNYAAPAGTTRSPAAGAPALTPYKQAARCALANW